MDEQHDVTGRNSTIGGDHVGGTKAGQDYIEGEVSVEGDDALTVVGKNVNQDITRLRDQVVGGSVQINVPGWNPTVSHGQDSGRGDISVSVEAELRGELGRLRDTINNLAVQVGRLDTTLVFEVKSTEARFAKIEELLEKFSDIAKEPRSTLGTNALYSILFVLGLIAILLGIGLWMLANGGGV